MVLLCLHKGQEADGCYQGIAPHFFHSYGKITLFNKPSINIAGVLPDTALILEIALAKIEPDIIAHHEEEALIPWLVEPVLPLQLRDEVRWQAASAEIF